MPDLEVSDEFLESAITRITSTADGAVFTSSTPRYSADQTGSNTVGSVMADSQALRTRLHEVVRDNMVALSTTVKTARFEYGYADQSLAANGGIR